jgi:hypothetical protein
VAERRAGVQCIAGVTSVRGVVEGEVLQRVGESDFCGV